MILVVPGLIATTITLIESIWDWIKLRRAGENGSLRIQAIGGIRREVIRIVKQTMIAWAVFDVIPLMDALRTTEFYDVAVHRNVILLCVGLLLSVNSMMDLYDRHRIVRIETKYRRQRYHTLTPQPTREQ